MFDSQVSEVYSASSITYSDVSSNTSTIMQDEEVYINAVAEPIILDLHIDNAEIMSHEDDDNYSLPDITGRVTIFTAVNASEKSESKKAQRPKFERYQ